MMVLESKEQVTAQIPKSHVKVLKRISKKHGVALAKLIRFVLKEFLVHYEFKCELCEDTGIILDYKEQTWSMCACTSNERDVNKLEEVISESLKRGDMNDGEFKQTTR